MPYLGRGSDNGFSIRNRYIFTATANQQNFSGEDDNSNTLALEDGFLTDVFVNGIMLKPTTDYTLNNSTNTLSLVSAADANEEVTILVYQIFALSDAMPTSGGTFSGALTNNSTTTFNDDVTFTGANYNAVWDKSDNALEFGDNASLKFGADGDLKIFHDSVNNIIRGTDKPTWIQSDGNVYITKNQATEYMALFFADGSVQLYYDHSKKIETTSTGATVTGTLTATTLAGTLSTAAQPNITSVGTLTGLIVGDNAGGDINLTTNSQAGTQASPLNMDINFKGYNNNVMAIIRSHDESSSTGHGELQFHTTKAGVGTTEKLKIDHSGNLIIPSDASDFTFATNSLHIGAGADIKIGHTNNNNVILSDNGMPFAIYTDVFRCNSADNTESLFGATKNSSFFAKFDNNTVLQTTALGALVSRSDTSCTFEMKANTSSGTGTPQFMMFRSGTRHGFMEAGVNSSANGGGNHFVLRAEQGDVFAIDSSNNSTQLSPHNFDYIPDGASETGAWCYKSDKFEKEVIEKDEEGNKIKEKIKSGTFISADMTKVIRQVEKLTGEKLIYKGTLDVNEDGEVSKHIDDGSIVKDNIIADLIKRIEALEEA